MRFFLRKIFEFYMFSQVLHCRQIGKRKSALFLVKKLFDKLIYERKFQKLKRKTVNKS